MTKRRPSTNIVLVAFVAIAGMLSFADAASACSAKPVSLPLACCSVRPPSECGCCGDGQALPTPAFDPGTVATVLSPARAFLQAPTASCECRASQPAAAPSERPAQRASTDRSEMPSGETSAAFTPALRRSPSPGHLLLPNESPPGSPLYLRTSRLLI